jgi:exodeoxyribonuclease VII small subunit
MSAQSGEHDGAAPREPSESYDALFRRLEETLRELEREEVPLERAMQLFQEGVALSRTLAARLEEAEQKVYRLVAEAGGGFGLQEIGRDALGGGTGTRAGEEEGGGDDE